MSLKKGTSKVVSVETSGTWESKNSTMINHNYVLEDGQKIQASHKSEKPIGIGEEVEYEVKRQHETHGDSGSVKKPGDFKPGGGRTIMQKMTDTERMCRSNAISAYATVNNVYNQEIITKGDIATIEKFTTGDITGDIEKFGPEASLHTSRLSAMNLAALMTTIEGYKNVDELIDKANKLYQYITK